MRLLRYLRPRRWLGRVRERSDPWTVVPARAAALSILSARYPAADGLPTDSVFELAPFQKDAVRRAGEILERRGGVLIADSVGLGKTFVALGLVDRALRRGGRVAVTTPASLRREWILPLRRLARRLKVSATFGLGSIEGMALALDVAEGRSESGPEEPRPAPNGVVSALAWISHARLSRGTHRPDRLAPLDLVVVDEAHAFRSPATRRYRALAELCRGARVVLVTATPVNNSVLDLYHQLRLFANDDTFADVGVAGLESAFLSAAADGPPRSCRSSGFTPALVDAGRSLLPILRTVTVRRTRGFLREHYGGVRLPGRGGMLAFPSRAPPVAVRYRLDDEGSLCRVAAEALEALTFAAARAAGIGSEPVPPGSRGGAAELMRLLLLKRLESSVAAFRSSLVRQIRFHQSFLRAVDEGRLLAPAEHRSLHVVAGDDDVAQLVLSELALREAPGFLDCRALSAEARRDLRRLEVLRAALGPDDPARDPKLVRLEALLDEELRGEKVVVFTEYRDTARYLWRALIGRGGVGLVDGGGAFLGGGPCGRRQVIERFAPRANQRKPPPRREAVDLLIATDVLSEGLNLQDAGRVISYDLPWNPVRLIQRVGRIDRLGSPHEVIGSYHFLPDPDLEDLLRLIARIRSKLGAIGRTVGADGAVLGSEEQAGYDYDALVERLAAGDPGVLEDLERRDAAPYEAEEMLWAARTEVLRTEALLSSLAAADTEATTPQNAPPAAVDPGATATQNVPPAAVVPGPRHEVLVACSSGGRPVWLLVDAETLAVREDDDAATRIILAALAGEDTAAASADAPASLAASVGRGSRGEGTRAAPSGSRAREAVAAAMAYLAAGASVRTPPALPPHSACARAARRLLALLAEVPGGPDPALCRRADAVLSALSGRLAAGMEAAVGASERSIGRGSAGELERLVEALEGALGSPAARQGLGGTGAAGGREAGGASAVVLVGVIEVRPPG